MHTCRLLFSLFTGACVVLHNLAILLREPQPQPQDDDEDAQDDERADEDLEQGNDGRRVRDHITHTFFSV